jgi:hypothetical protein
MKRVNEERPISRGLMNQIEKRQPVYYCTAFRPMIEPEVEERLVERKPPSAPNFD